jgi:hypothetical protein
MESGVGKCPFLGICFTSPSNICWKLYPQYLGDVQLGHLPTPAFQGDIESFGKTVDSNAAF